jgi:hypothetical protein
VLWRFSSLLLAATTACAAALASCGGEGTPAAEQGELSCQVKPSETFHERIEPLLQDDRQSTCNQCHLSGVNLSVFARETACKTWACLTERQLVDVDDPENSLVLSWILRASPQSELITADVIQAEHDAFLDWIEANAACPTACAGVTCGKPNEGPTCSSGHSDPEPEVPSGADDRGCSDLELEQAFYDDVYAWRGRCFPCHFDTELKADAAAPRWLSAVGNCESGSAVSLKRVIDLGLIDTANPKQSLLLRKPLDVVGGGVAHGGGAKFTVGDPALTSFTRFVEHYSACQTK